MLADCSDSVSFLMASTMFPIVEYSYRRCMLKRQSQCSNEKLANRGFLHVNPATPALQPKNYAICMPIIMFILDDHALSIGDDTRDVTMCCSRL